MPSNLFSHFFQLPRFLQLEPVPYAESAFGDEKFEAILDVNAYKPEEISVEVNERDQTITVEGKRQEDGKTTRVRRRYVLPRSYDISKVDCEVSSDGVLAITAPKIEETGEQGRKILLKATGKPFRAKL